MRRVYSPDTWRGPQFGDEKKNPVPQTGWEIAIFEIRN
jgi:hypothetical protein